jgi:hypothetical protein
MTKTKRDAQIGHLVLFYDIFGELKPTATKSSEPTALFGTHKDVY